MCQYLARETYIPLSSPISHTQFLSLSFISLWHTLSLSLLFLSNKLTPASFSLSQSLSPSYISFTNTHYLSLSFLFLTLSLSDTHSLLSQFPSLFPFPFSAPFSKSQLNENAVRLFSVISCFNVERCRKILKIRRSVEDRVCTVNTHKVVRSKISKVRQG